MPSLPRFLQSAWGSVAYCWPGSTTRCTCVTLYGTPSTDDPTLPPPAVGFLTPTGYLGYSDVLRPRRFAQPGPALCTYIASALCTPAFVRLSAGYLGYSGVVLPRLFPPSGPALCRNLASALCAPASVCLSTGYLGYSGVVLPRHFGSLQAYQQVFVAVWRAEVVAAGLEGVPEGLPMPAARLVLFQTAMATLQMLWAGIIHL